MANERKPAARKPTAPESADAPECYACPIGSVSRALRASHPDTTDHLIRAGRELLLAARGIIDLLSDSLGKLEDRGSEATVETIPIRRV